MRELKKNKKGFTLIETIVALGLVALIAAFLLPPLASLLNFSNKIQDKSKIIFAMEEAIERNKNEDVSVFKQNINGIDILVEISDYDLENNLKRISVEHDTYKLDLVVEKP